MSDPREDDPQIDGAIEAAARDWYERGSQSVSEHPDPDALVDYQEGRLDSRLAERVRQHLVFCADCRAEILVLDTFDEEGAEDAALRPSDEDTEQSWQRFQAARETARQAADGPSEPARQPVGRRATTWMLAAAVAVAVLGAGFLTGRLTSDLDSAGQIAEGSPFIFDLRPTGSLIRRGAEPLEQVSVPSSMSLLIPRLAVGDQTAYDRYSAEIYAEGRLVTRRDGLARAPTGSLTFLIPRSEWPDGEATILLLGMRAGQRHEIASYAVRLRFDE